MRDVISRPIQALWGNKSPKIDVVSAIQSLIEQISDAAVIYDEQQNRILQVNSAYLVLSAFSATEIINSPLEEIFEDFDKENLDSPDPHQATLKLRNRPVVPVIMRSAAIDPNTPWRIIRIVPKIESLYAGVKWMETILDALRDLPEAISGVGLNESLLRLLNVVHELFNTNLVCIYYAKPEIPELDKLVTLEEITFFPETLPSTDLIRLGSPNIWTPGRRVVTDLHRAARLVELTYAASVPLSQENSLSGLLVVGGVESQPPPLLLDILSVFGVYTNFAFDLAIRSENIAEKLSSQTLRSAIQGAFNEYTDEGLLVLNQDLTVTPIKRSMACRWRIY
jgi:two-component system sensor histidine kinase AtoS